MHLFIFFSLAISALAQTSLGSRSSVIPRAKIAPLSSVIDLLGATSGSTALDALKSSHPVQPLRRAILNRRFLTHSSANCIGSQYSESHINALFSFGGPNTTVNLCANAKISIFAPIQFTAKNQTLVTLGAPNDSTRALIVVWGAHQTCAIDASTNADYASIRNIQINGNRVKLGQTNTLASAIVEMGGNSQGQIITQVYAYDPTGWSIIHVSEGASDKPCRNAIVSNNDIGPSGTDDVGKWADGLSIACFGTKVFGNTIVDATDGGIVIFNGQISVHDNKIISNTRTLLGGINMVDSGVTTNYTGSVIANNLIISNTSMIKIGIALGPQSWGADNSTRTTGGTFVNNTLTSGSSGYFAFGSSVSGHLNPSIRNMSFKNASFGGVASNCIPGIPLPQPLVQGLYHSSPAQVGYNSTTQVQYLLCYVPGTITLSGFNA